VDVEHLDGCEFVEPALGVRPGASGLSLARSVTCRQ
jgi:hypothetical protein